MSEARRKITLYLHPTDNPVDEHVATAIQNVPLRIRGEFFRQAFIAGVALSATDQRLPALIAALFDRELDAPTLSDCMALLGPHDSTQAPQASNSQASMQAVAWQRRSRDVLHVKKPWSTWFSIVEDEFLHHTTNPNPDTQVRALFAYSMENECAVIAPPETAPNTPRQLLAEKAKKMFSDE